ncbi:MAG: hypothetical protein CMJ48_12625 [Planctomycetaceae bacterium]|nr:hypothetical protein [Planctomycetaceae bacterium]
MTVHPSISAGWWGKLLGSLLEAFPTKFCGIKLSHALFWLLPGVPIGLAAYFWGKVFGERYRLTNRSLQVVSSLKGRLIEQISLGDIDEILVQQAPGQIFYKAADIVLVDAKGAPIVMLPGISRAEVFRQTILEARDARREVEASLATIQAREA